MKRPVTIIAVVLVLGAAVVFGLDWHVFMLTGHFRPKRIVETLHAPVSIASVTSAGLLRRDGGLIRLPGVSNVVAPDSVAKDITEHGVEVQSNGTVFALIRVHHWCGNDPVRFHLARLDLSSLLLVLGEQKQARVAEFGIDPGVYGMATIPHDEVGGLFRHESSEQDGAANRGQPSASETNRASGAAGPGR